MQMSNVVAPPTLHMQPTVSIRIHNEYEMPELSGDRSVGSNLRMCVHESPDVAVYPSPGDPIDVCVAIEPVRMCGWRRGVNCQLYIIHIKGEDLIPQ